jgi:asparagine synthase (glutamine-hydrolysing)
MPAPGEHDPPKAHDRYAVMASGAAEGIGGDTFVFYVEDLYGEVVEAFGRHGILLGDRIALHRGLIEETLRLDEPIALLHVDTDWYDPVRISLERTWPLLSVGGYIVGDDYTTYDGARAAMDEFAGAHGPEVETLWEKGHLILRRLPLPAR